MESVGIINFWPFLVAAVLLNLTPGTDTMFILGRSMAHGTRAGVFSALGISTGSLVHTLAAASGLSLVLASSATAFSLVKYCGALYLIYLGVRAFFPAKVRRPTGEQSYRLINYRQVYVSGIVTNVLNPKVALFFLAFLPQFIDPVYPYTMLSFILLGSTFIITGTCWCLLLAVYSAKFSSLLQERSQTGNLMAKLTGFLFIGLGVKLAFMER
jgi:threonine/homoserine/homoserine lactone efflux protein